MLGIVVASVNKITPWHQIEKTESFPRIESFIPCRSSLKNFILPQKASCFCGDFIIFFSNLVNIMSKYHEHFIWVMSNNWFDVLFFNLDLHHLPLLAIR